VKRSIPFSACTEYNLNHSNWTDAKTNGLASYQCLDEKDFEIEGQFFANSFQYVTINLDMCKNSSKSNVTCKTK